MKNFFSLLPTLDCRFTTDIGCLPISFYRSLSGDNISLLVARDCWTEKAKILNNFAIQRLEFIKREKRANQDKNQWRVNSSNEISNLIEERRKRKKKEKEKKNIQKFAENALIVIVKINYNEKSRESSPSFSPFPRDHSPDHTHNFPDFRTGNELEKSSAQLPAELPVWMKNRLCHSCEQQQSSSASTSLTSGCVREWNALINFVWNCCVCRLDGVTWHIVHNNFTGALNTTQRFSHCTRLSRAIKIDGDGTIVRARV